MEQYTMRQTHQGKIFCIGLSRTGTTSLCEALSMLGYKTLHFSLDLFVHPEIISPDLKFQNQVKLNPYWAWRRKKEIKAINARFNPDLLDEYDAFGDLPIPLLYQELDVKFPNSKFIYTYRDEENWLRSMKWLYEDGAVLWNHGLLNDELKLANYGCNEYDEEILLNSYRSHHEKVMNYFADRKEDILAINIDKKKMDFTLLATFLGKPILDAPFPLSNGSQKVSKQKYKEYYRKKIPFFSFIKSKMT